MMSLIQFPDSWGKENPNQRQKEGSWDCLVSVSSTDIFSLTHLYHVEMFHTLGVRNYPSALFLLRVSFCF